MIGDDALLRAFDRARSAASDLRALLFDLDGTLADTMELHYEAYRHVLRERGGALSRSDFDRLAGPPAEQAIPRFAEAAGLAALATPAIAEVHARKKRAFAALLTRRPPRPLAAARLLRAMSGAAAIAVVTSGNRQGATAILAATGLAPLVGLVVTGDDVTRGKPAPEPYARALGLLGCGPEAALAFEDADDGVRSATGAGLTVIDVRTGEVIGPCDR